MNDKWYWSRLEDIFFLQDISLSDIDSDDIDKMVVILRDIHADGHAEGEMQMHTKLSNLVLQGMGH